MEEKVEKEMEKVKELVEVEQEIEESDNVKGFEDRVERNTRKETSDGSVSIRVCMCGVWKRGGGGGMRAVKEDSIYLIKIIWRRLNQAKRHQNQSVLACETARMGEYRVGETGLAWQMSRPQTSGTGPGLDLH